MHIKKACNFPSECAMTSVGGVKGEHEMWRKREREREREYTYIKR